MSQGVEYATRTLSVGDIFDEWIEPTRIGHTFSHWANASETIIFEEGDEITIDAPIAFYAHWDINEHTITFNTRGGSALTPVDRDWNTTYVLTNQPSYTGFTFLGWATSLENAEYGTIAHAPGAMITVTRDITLYAIWDRNFYRIEFRGTQDIPVNNLDPSLMAYFYIEHGERVSPLDPVPTRQNFTHSTSGATVQPVFNVWSTAAGDAGYAFDFDIPITTVRTLFAVWSYTYYFDVTFNAGAGEFADGYTTYTVTEEQGDTLSYTPVPTRPGYRFDFWTLDPTVAHPVEFLVATRPIITNYELYPVWEVVNRTVTFDPANGDETFTQQVQDTIGRATLPTEPTKQGHTFRYWALYGTTAAFNFANTLVTTNITLVALWDINQHAITFDTTGGNAMGSVTRNWNQAFELTTATRTGYNFMGWAIISGGEVVYESGDSITITGDRHFFAVWMVDRAPLEQAIIVVDSIDTTNYTEASLMTLQNARNVAYYVFNDPDATAEQVANAVSALNDAIANLEQYQDGNGIPWLLIGIIGGITLAFLALCLIVVILIKIRKAKLPAAISIG